MKYTVLQIPFPRTEAEEKIFHQYAFAPLSWIDHVHPEYYQKTYEGNIETSETNITKILDILFRELNINHPTDYKGHSLSVSDIIVIDNHYYYCDDFGWIEIDFNIL